MITLPPAATPPATDRGARVTSSHHEPKTPAPAEPTVRAILRDAPAPAVVRPPAKAAWACGAASAVLLWASFDPLGWVPLAWAALVPLCLLIRSRVRCRWEVRALWACGFVGTAAQIQWMRLGDPAMYPAWLALSAYLGVYFPLFVLACRGLIYKAKVPFAVAVPVVWCGLELCRGHLMTGFGWNLLAHSQWRWTTLIQCADLGGVYTVSAVVAAGSAALALCVPGDVLNRLGLAGEEADAPRFAPLRPAIGVAVLVGATLAYGAWRTAGAAFPAGPRVALVQTDHPSSLRADQFQAERNYFSYDDTPGQTLRLSRAATPYRPDLVIWPESALPFRVLHAAEGISDEQLAAATPGLGAAAFRQGAAQIALANLAEEAGAHLLTGATVGEVADPDGAGPRPPRFARFGSAVLAAPRGGRADDGTPRGRYAGRYDKRHRVVFGEYIPLRDWLPGLASLTPFTEDPGAAFGVAAGDGPASFELTTAAATTAEPFTVAPLICFEDTVPHLARATVNTLAAGPSGAPDVLAVVSNDGWFARSAEQEQHHAVAVFRAVETRTPVVRASNTGVSSAIDGDGVPRPPVAWLTEDGTEADPTPTPDDTAGTLVCDVPLDPRGSLYLLWGDWPMTLCAGLAVLGLAWNMVPRRA